MEYSLTYVGTLVALLATVGKLLGIEVGSEELTTTVLTVLQFAGSIGALIGRWRLGGVNLLGFRK